MYALVNTMSKLDNYVGTIMSLHRSEDAANAANARHQRLVRKHSRNSYLPTTVVRLTVRAARGQMLHRSDITA